MHREFSGEKMSFKPLTSLLNKTDTYDGHDFDIDALTDEVNALQKELLVLFEGYCIFGYTAAKMTWFWARFKQNDLQNCTIKEILAKSYRIVPQNCAEFVPKLLLRIPLYVDFSILIPLCSKIMSIHCFIGIFVGPLNTYCIKYQANQNELN